MAEKEEMKLSRWIKCRITREGESGEEQKWLFTKRNGCCILLYSVVFCCILLFYGVYNIHTCICMYELSPRVLCETGLSDVLLPWHLL